MLRHLAAILRYIAFGEFLGAASGQVDVFETSPN